MSNDDPTTKLPGDEAGYDTKPGITAVLERINALGEQLNKRIGDAVQELRAEMHTYFNDVALNVAKLRRETELNFDKLDRKLDVLHGDIIDVKEKHRKLEKRLDDLENKPS